jgi:hypothetical protein
LGNKRNCSSNVACRHGYAVRMLPRHDDLPHRYDTGLSLWG